MSTRKNTKFNKNTGYKDFTFSKMKANNDVYNVTANSKNQSYSEVSSEAKLDSKINNNIK